MSDGRFLRGKSGNPSGRPANKGKQQAEKFLLHADEAVRTILARLRSDDESISLKAATEILDRVYGKPTQAVEVKSEAIHSFMVQILPMEIKPKEIDVTVEALAKTAPGVP